MIIIDIIHIKRYNAYNTNDKGMNHDWACVTASRAFFLMRWHDTSHRFFVSRPAVHRTRLQAAKSRTEIQNNRYNTRNNAYNSLNSAEC